MIIKKEFNNEAIFNFFGFCHIFASLLPSTQAPSGGIYHNDDSRLVFGILLPLFCQLMKALAKKREIVIKSLN